MKYISNKTDVQIYLAEPEFKKVKVPVKNNKGIVVASHSIEKIRGVMADFSPSGDGGCYFLSEWWEKTGAKSEKDFIELMDKSADLGLKFWKVKEIKKG